MIRGIDISHWQGDIDFNKVKNAEIDFCIIKAGGSDAGFYTDKMYETNYNKAKAAGLKVGAYILSVRISEAQKMVLQMLRGF
jgi:GH25 family lysozyme M1 (1,4-beta-N-acetylmuramidase)